MGSESQAITIRLPAQAVKSGSAALGMDADQQGRDYANIWKLVLFNFSVNECLDDGPQKFLGDNVNDLRTHLVENPLDDSFHQLGIGRNRLRNSSGRLL